MRRPGVVGAVVMGIGALALLGVAGAGHASATSCAGTGSIAQAIDGGGAVFVGTVVSTTNRGRWATFAVEEVWSGDVSPTQVVKSGPPPDPQHGTFSGIGGEHTFEPGGQYLVDAVRPPASGIGSDFADDDHPFRPGDLVDEPCSLTAPWSGSFAVDRPASAREVDHPDPIVVVGALADPRPVGRHDGRLLGLSRPWQLGLAIGFALAASALAVVWWRSRREVDAPVP